MAALIYEFLRDSLPDHRRQRFGDIDYDWEFRVDTTSANVSWRSRLIGLLNSAYQPVDPGLFREMMNSLPADFSQFTFVDIGSGKGRALLLAAEYPFRSIIGVELLSELNAIAEENVQRLLSRASSNVMIQTICADATQFHFPDGPLIVFLNNPLPRTGLVRLMHNLHGRLLEHSDPIFVLYANPVLEDVFNGNGAFRKLTGTHQYAIFVGESHFGDTG